MAELTPMMKQYLDIKKNNPDSILFFRLGDFYEMFDEDAPACVKGAGPDPDHPGPEQAGGGAHPHVRGPLSCGGGPTLPG